MDFASAPFQTLLIENASDDQLFSFLKQLDQQFRLATDEKVRFGNLQILLPIFKAYLVRQNDFEKEKACLQEFIQPWMKASFSQDSMISTESVQSLEKLLSFLMGRSLLLYSNQPANFGQSTLISLTSQLVAAIEAEPDFIDLKPVEFIESNLDDRTLWETILRESTTIETPLDLECCLDILYLFVRDLIENENEEILDIAAKHTESKNSVYQCLHILFVIATAMVPCTDATIRTKLGHDLLPNLLRWQQNSNQDIAVEKQDQWCEIVWTRTLQIFGLPATNLLRLEIYGLIARFFDYYFGINDASNEPAIHKDLRFDVNFFKILQSGLRSNDSLARKYSSYILKRIIDFTDKNPQTISKDVEWTPYFKWDISQSKAYLDHWDDWFLLYDIMHETVIHLVDPVLPRFETLVNADVFDPSWWILLLYRGFQNDIGSVKKGLLEFIFSRRDPRILNKLAIEQTFMFGAFFKYIDSTALFQVPTQGTLVSPFGESLRSFMLHLINAIENKQDKVQFLRQLIHHLSHVISSYVPILYTMESLTEVDPVEAWGPEELKSLRMLVDRHRNFNIPATKQFLRKLGIAAVVRLCNTATLSFSDIAKTISSLVNEYPVKTTSNEFKLIRFWLINRISSDKSINGILDGLKSRFRAYVCDLKSEDIPEAVLRSQANVLARTSVFVVSGDDGELNSEFLTDLLNVFTETLKNPECDNVVFARLLTLLNALWENFAVTFENIDFVKKIGLNQDDLVRILERIESKYLNKEDENAVDDDIIDLYLSLTQFILLSETTLDKDTKLCIIQKDYDKLIELLKYRPSSLDPNVEMSKPAYLRLLAIVYQVARQFSYFKLSCDQETLTLVYGFQMKRTQEALRERSWGDCLSRFIKCKWECVAQIILYATDVKKLQDDSREFFDPFELYDEAVDQLESSSEMCGEAIIRSFGPILAFPFEKTAEMLDRCIDNAFALMDENAFQSRTYPLLIKAFIDVIFQPELLSIKELNQEGGPMKRALNMVLQTGELKPYIVARTAELLHNYWSSFTEETVQSMIDYAPELAQLLVFGPLRDREDQKIEAALASKIATEEEVLEAEGTAQVIFSQNDYLVRVNMNDLLLRLDVNNKDHITLANLLLANFLRIINEDTLFEFMFMATAEHRLKIRICCSLMLIIDLATEDKLDGYLDIFFEVMRKETVTSVRCYLEWATVRLLRRFPDRLSTIYEKIADPNHKPNFVISVLTITFTLGDVLPDSVIQSYFEQIFVLLLPWLITNHFTIRLFSYCAWHRNWKSCQERGFGKEFEDNKYIQSIRKFMETYVDCIKFFDKIQASFYMSHFDPIQDFNVEFIFRQMMSAFQVIDNEKIGSKSFIKINSTVVERCPFENPARKEVYTSADPTEMIGLEEVTESTQKEAAGTDSEDVFQKKIMPWEMMLETDMDLTKNLVKKNRRRNDLIVVASLIDRLPNLAGLCRTCEIFNASQLVVPSLKIKDDLGFTTVSVASEKWMPMAEVAEADVGAYLKQKKDEGYTLCGLEQTTTSAVLGDYEFPEKCILLLGKERQGVPADLLQMLDVTIEIPQYGITRSLNVHVSGAICIYEYTKQMHWRQQQAAINQQ